MLFLIGCAAHSNQRVDTLSSANNKLLEKRIDDLSTTIALIVNDANSLHNKMEEIRTSNKAFQQKVEGLEVTISDLSNRIASLYSLTKTAEIIHPPAEESALKISTSHANNSKPPDKLKTDIQKTEDAEHKLAVAKGFWDAINADDIYTARSYATKKSGDSLELKKRDTSSSGKVTFGDVKNEGDMTIIETIIQASEGETKLEFPIKTVLVKEDGQWKVDFDQTLMSMFGGVVGEMIEGFKKGFEEIGKSMADDLQKGFGETIQTSEIKPDVTPLEQGAKVVNAASEQSVVEGIQKDTRETTLTSEKKPNISPSGQEVAVTSEISEHERRELFLRDNVVRLAETEFTGSKGIQWNILGLEHKAHLTHTEVEPVPANLDYPRFKLVVSFKNPGMPRVIGMFCLKDGQYILYSAKRK